MRKWSTILFVLLLCGCEKARLDEQVRELCAKDGGIKVHETVALPADKFDQFGEVRLVERSLTKAADEYFYIYETNHMRTGNPSLRRDHVKLYRRADNRVLGEGVSYARRGGDLPGPWHDSSFRCPEHASEKDVAVKVFQKLVLDKESK